MAPVSLHTDTGAHIHWHTQCQNTGWQTNHGFHNMFVHISDKRTCGSHRLNPWYSTN